MRLLHTLQSFKAGSQDFKDTLNNHTIGSKYKKHCNTLIIYTIIVRVLILIFIMFLTFIFRLCEHVYPINRSDISLFIITTLPP